MSNLDLQISVEFKSSRWISEEICFGSYEIRPKPPSKQETISKETYLEFIDQWKDGQIGSNPFREAEYILSLLSVFGRTNVVVASQAINQRKLAPVPLARFVQFEGQLILPKDARDLYAKLLSLPSNLFEKYIRSCMTYRKATSILAEDPTLGCFLLVVAIECLSDTLGGSGLPSTKFYNFILSNISAEFMRQEGNKKSIEELLKQVWKIYRVGFTHGGKPIPLGALIAEKAQRRYFTQIYKGKEMRFPSVTWFENLVREVLVEFLRRNKRHKSIVNDRKRFAEMAQSESAVLVRLKKPKRPGEVVFTSEVNGFG